jgi:flagellar motor switch protein FliM
MDPMNGDFLSQSEVESLLNTTARDEPRAGSMSFDVWVGMGSDDAGGGRGHGESVDPFGPCGRRALEALRDPFAKGVGAALSAMLRSPTDVRLAGVDHLRCREFLFGLESPTCVSLIKTAPLGNAILELRPSILFPMIDRLLGSGREASSPIPRPLTEIDRRLVALVIEVFLDELRHAWKDVDSLNLAVVQTESDPQRVRAIPPAEAVALARFDVTAGASRGGVNLCIPVKILEGIGERLVLERLGQEKAHSPLPAVRNLLVELGVELTRTRITAGELFDLGIGDVIATEQDVDAPLVVTVDGVPTFFGRPGIFDGRKAICIEGPAAGVGDARLPS